MASRRMAAMRVKMSAPYTANQLMVLQACACPGSKGRTPAPEVLDELAELALTGGWKLDRWGACTACGQCRTASGQCGCAMYVPAAPDLDAGRRRQAVARLTPSERRRIAVYLEFQRAARTTARPRSRRELAARRHLGLS